MYFNSKHSCFIEHVLSKAQKIYGEIRFFKHLFDVCLQLQFDMTSHIIIKVFSHDLNFEVIHVFVFDLKEN